MVEKPDLIMSWIEYWNSTDWRQAGWLSLGAYLLGCFTAGYYLLRLRTGGDLREVGSGNVGARNAGRVLGRSGFLLTVIFDFGKGALAIWVAQHFTSDRHTLMMVMLAVVAGHVCPVQLHFRGGKGMATSLGALLVFNPHLVFPFAAIFFLLFIVMRRTVVPALAALAGLPVAAVFLGDDPFTALLLSILVGLVLITHRKNLVEEFWQLVERRHAHPKT
jgi:acyl phosphate:glycerol-3-phosphate acyltransferase